MTQGLQAPIVETLRLKGPRERIDSGMDLNSSNEHFMARIWQCDQKAWISLRDFNKTYSIASINSSDRSDGPRRERSSNLAQKPEGPPVTITTDSEDTGERRQTAGYELRHIKTTMTVEPSPGASTAASKMEVDGWYVDLPGLSCHDEEAGQRLMNPRWHFPIKPGSHDKLEYVNKGIANVGRVVEETATIRSEGNLQINKVELLEFSNVPLDQSLFEIPPGYTEQPHPLIQQTHSQNKVSAKPNE